jgi:hypothetical protein
MPIIKPAIIQQQRTITKQQNDKSESKLRLESEKLTKKLNSKKEKSNLKQQKHLENGHNNNRPLTNVKFLFDQSPPG